MTSKNLSTKRENRPLLSETDTTPGLRKQSTMTIDAEKLREVRERAKKKAEASTTVAEDTSKYLPDSRPPMFVHTITLDTAVAQGVGAMASATRGGKHYVYRQVSSLGEPKALVTIKPTGQPRIWPEGDAAALVYLMVQPVKKGVEVDGEVYPSEYDTAFPPNVARAIYAQALHDPRIPAVRIISTAPVLLPDGRIAREQGYNADVQVLITYAESERDAWAQRYMVPDEPTLEEAQAAAEYVMYEVLGDVPCAGDEDKATSLVYFATCATRDMYGTAPFFAFDAPERGTGKSLVASCGRIIGQGHSNYQSIGYRKGQDAEIWKSLGTLALKNGRHAHVDELPRDDRVNSTALSEIATTPVASTRLLGANSEIVLEGLMVTVCGNNITLGLDFNRRFFKARLHFVGSDAAYRRGGFRHKNLARWVAQHRPELLAALHTVVRYGLQNGIEPEKSLGSYEDWSSVVLGALSVITINGASVTDLALSAQATLSREEDEVADEWGGMLAAIHQHFDEQQWHEMVEIHKGMRINTPEDVELPEVLLMAGGNFSDQARAWSKHFKTMKDTPVEFNGERYAIRWATIRSRPRFRVVRL